VSPWRQASQFERVWRRHTIGGERQGLALDLKKPLQGYDPFS